MNEEKPEEIKEENKRLPIVANGRGLVLRSMDDMWRFACAVRDSGMAPSSFTKPEQILIALQSGAELGMPPMRALQSFCVINGAARLWGDAPLALVRQSGLLEYIKEGIEGEGENMVATCETKRKDDPEPKVTQFSMEDAKLAGLLDKKGNVWKQYPKRMLMYRARSFNLRDNFPDCFGGATIAEEYEALETPEPSHETTTPKRKVVEIEQTDAKPNDDALIKTAIIGVYDIYEKRVGNTASVELFAELSAKVCGGAKDDYWIFDDAVEPTLKPAAYTMDGLVQIKKSLEEETQTQPEVLDDYLYVCNEPKCGERFNEPKTSGNGANTTTICPKCLSKNISAAEEVDAK